jgi:HTH-type transcriptional regulator/antitoxin HigA
VKKKQNSFSPNYTVPPGETLLETIKALGMTQADLAMRTSHSQKVINQIIRGKTPISVRLAHKFERVLEVPASFWISLEKNYRKGLSRLHGEKNGQD